MKTHFVFLIITLLMISSLKAQVKIGDSPQNIDPASVLELESSNRVLVITRVTDSQMNAINPLPGALVYNTDAECIHYFNGTEWINICEALDNSFTTSTQAVFNTAPDSRDSTVVVTQTETPDGINYNFEVNRITGDNIYNRTIYGVDLAFGSISEAELQNGAVGLTKLAAGTAVGQLMQWDGTNWVLIPETDIIVTEIDGVIGNEILDAADGTLVRSGAGDVGDPFVLGVAPQGITNNELGPDAVTTDKILDGTVSNADLEDDIITNTKMATNAIGTLELIDDSVDRDKIDADVAGIGLIQAADGSLEVDVASLTGDGDITSTDLNVTGGTDAAFNDVTLEIADDAITSAKILDGAVNTDDIADLAITNAKLGNGAVSTGKIGTGAVNSAAIANNGIATIDIADDAVTAAKINVDVAGSGLIQAVDGSLEVDVASLTGDGDITSTDLNVTGGTDAAFNDVTLEIANNAITSAKILDGTINTIDIADLAITNAKLGNGAVSTGKIGTGAVNSAAIANNGIATIDLADDAVTAAKINGDVAGIGLIQAGDGSLQVDYTTIEADWTNINNIPTDIADGDNQNLSIGTGGTPNQTIEVLISGGTSAIVDIQDADFDPTNEIQDAVDVNIDDAGGNFTATEVEGALAELAASNAADLDTDPNNEIQDAVDVNIDDAGGNFTATEVEGALAELAVSNSANTTAISNILSPVVAGKIDATGTTLSQFNIMSVTPGGTGIYTVNFADLGSTNYVINTSVESNGTNDVIINISAVTNTSFTVEIKEIISPIVPYLDDGGDTVNIPETQVNPIDKNWSFTIFNF